MNLGTQVKLGPDHIVLDRYQATRPPNGHSPQRSAHICCGQMAGRIKTPHGMELGLGPGDFLIDGDSVPLHKKGQSLPIFTVPLGTEVGLSLGDIVLDGNPAPLGWMD